MSLRVPIEPVSSAANGGARVCSPPLFYAPFPELPAAGLFTQMPRRLVFSEVRLLIWTVRASLDFNLERDGLGYIKEIRTLDVHTAASIEYAASSAPRRSPKASSYVPELHPGSSNEEVGPLEGNVLVYSVIGRPPYGGVSPNHQLCGWKGECRGLMTCKNAS